MQQLKPHRRNLRLRLEKILRELESCETAIKTLDTGFLDPAGNNLTGCWNCTVEFARITLKRLGE
jgi:hypothetical protein